MSLIFVRAVSASARNPLSKAAPAAVFNKLRRDQSPTSPVIWFLNLRQPTLAVAPEVPAPLVLLESVAPQKAPRRREEWVRCVRCRRAPAHDAEHEPVPTHRANLPRPGSGNGCVLLPHSHQSGKRRKSPRSKK